MTIAHTAEHREGYTVVRVDGEPTLDEFLVMLATVGAESAQWPNRRALFDMRSVRTLKAFTEHYAIGEAAARHFGHLQKLASVVPADRITRASEKTARRAGANLTVFTSEGEAIAWLASNAP
ncbi:STAS/SEC14 domain-containing protein [Ramlibacter terrae]|uniref:STAS/SEC14 domain-containing protein n=1 Tax=Ramlibacter terrae TaxID=2732511 RepID=A0ABX6P2U5_9BURK|nr:STAS/SEC14 domain-containing protein [Ramlibacter terrae]